MLKRFLLIVSLLMSAYGLAIYATIGGGRIFNYFYLAAGSALLAFSLLYDKIRQFLGKKGFRILLTVLFLLAAVFMAGEAQIISFSMKGPENNADYVIILGSQLRRDGPSVDFRARLDKGYAYLNENPSSLAVTTGGQGMNEPKSEGEGGADYLIARGIAPERILIESKSANTEENLQNAYKIIKADGQDPQKARIVIVSGAYHLLRAKLLASRIGFENTSFLGSHGLPILDPHYYTREFFALIKELLFGR